MQLVMYQPDFPHNLGMVLRLGACFDVPVHVIEPCGFPFDDKRIKLRALDYDAHVKLHRHASWEAFQTHQQALGGRLILSSTKSSSLLYGFTFEANDWLIFGSESSGVSELVHQCVDARVLIPMSPAIRSFNVATAAAMVLSEAIRQIRYAPISA